LEDDGEFFDALHPVAENEAGDFGGERKWKTHGGEFTPDSDGVEDDFGGGNDSGASGRCHPDTKDDMLLARCLSFIDPRTTD
jgi:hypothetical protein